MRSLRWNARGGRKLSDGLSQACGLNKDDPDPHPLEVFCSTATADFERLRMVGRGVVKGAVEEWPSAKLRLVTPRVQACRATRKGASPGGVPHPPPPNPPHPPPPPPPPPPPKRSLGNLRRREFREKILRILHTRGWVALIVRIRLSRRIRCIGGRVLGVWKTAAISRAVFSCGGQHPGVSGGAAISIGGDWPVSRPRKPGTDRTRVFGPLAGSPHRAKPCGQFVQLVHSQTRTRGHTLQSSAYETYSVCFHGRRIRPGPTLCAASGRLSIPSCVRGRIF